eukprot:8411971-Pyramimonas_sp.AAC.1
MFVPNPERNRCRAQFLPSSFARPCSRCPLRSCPPGAAKRWGLPNRGRVRHADPPAGAQGGVHDGVT